MLKVYLWNLRVLSLVSKKLLIINFIVSVLDGVSMLFYSYLISRLIDTSLQALSQGKDMSSLIPLTILVFGYYVFIGLIRVVINYSETYFRQKLMIIPNKILFEKLNELGVEQTEKPEIQNKINRFKENSGLFFSQFTNITLLFANVATIVTAIGILLIYTPLIVPLVLVLLLPKVITNRYYLKRIWKLDKSYTPIQRKTSSISQFMNDPATFKEIYLSGSSDFFTSTYQNLKNDYLKSLFGLRNKWFTYIGLFRVLDALMITIGLFMALTLLFNNKISIGQLTFLLTTIVNFRGVLETVVFTTTNLSESAVRLKDSKELFDVQTEDSKGNEVLKDLPPAIEFKNISFKYPGSESYAIKNLDLKLEAGEKVAIVGHNGAGKTTLIKLLTGIYKVTEGEILINGININKLNLVDWYKKLGVLFQDYNNYDFLSVKENIIVGDISKKESIPNIEKALKDSDALNFVNNYPNKLDNILSEKYDGGIRPSTGQWQKIAIARFFYRDSPVLILDEPTASIDAVSEASIFDNIYEFIKNKTVIIVSHRFSTVRKADRIIVIEQGKIVENGTHADLLALGQYYYKAFNLQAKGYSE